MQVQVCWRYLTPELIQPSFRRSGVGRFHSGRRSLSQAVISTHMLYFRISTTTLVLCCSTFEAEREGPANRLIKDTEYDIELHSQMQQEYRKSKERGGVDIE